MLNQLIGLLVNSKIIFMDIQHRDDGKEGIFYVEQDGKSVAEMDYYWQGPHTIVITHTGVNESLEGQGIGRQLVEKGILFARERKLTLVPQCPFARKLINDTPEFQDVLKPQ